MGLVLLLAIVAVILFGLGFVVKWLFIAAVIVALLAVVSFFMGRSRTGARL